MNANLINEDSAYQEPKRKMGVLSPEQAWSYSITLGFIVLALFLIYPWLASSAYKGSLDLHATIEMVGSLFGLLAGFVLISRFYIRLYTLGSRFYLFIGLAFFINGAEDFVHGFLPFASSRGWIHLPATSLTQFIPATYVTGRLLMALVLIFSPFMDSWLGESQNPKTEAKWVSIIAVAVTLLATAMAFNLPFPKLIFPENLISRPVDFLSAILLAVALVLFLREFHKERDLLTWWICLSIGVNIAGQVLMSFSKELFDPFFDIAHVYKVLGYMLPLIGASLFQVAAMRGMSEAIKDLALTSARISSAVEQHERSASTQASSANETAATVKELNASARLSAERADSASKASDQTNEVIGEGDKSVKEALDGIKSLKEKMDLVAGQILHLSEQTSQIEMITVEVANLASRTNLLALNAAVEAARAGEHGKGFAVVASEIRKLADSSKKSVERIRTLVNEILKSTNSTVMITEEGTKTVEHVTELSEKSSKAFGSLASFTESISGSLKEIGLSIKEQSLAIQQIVESIDLMNASAKGTAEGISESREGLQKLNEVAQSIKDII